MHHALRYCHINNLNIIATEINENKLDKFIKMKKATTTTTTTLIKILSTVKENNISILNPLLSLFTVLVCVFSFEIKFVLFVN